MLINSTEGASAGSKPTLTMVYDTGINHPPTAGNNSYRIQPGQTELAVAAPGVLGNDSDPDGDALTANLVSGPSQGSVALAAGSFIYAPGPDFTISDTLTDQAKDRM